MIGRILSAVVGRGIDRAADGRGGPKGAAIGYFAPRVIARLGTPGLVAAGGYGLYRLYSERRKRRSA
jgi:hypothetical protein